MFLISVSKSTASNLSHETLYCSLVICHPLTNWCRQIVHVPKVKQLWHETHPLLTSVWYRAAEHMDLYLNFPYIFMTWYSNTGTSSAIFILYLVVVPNTDQPTAVMLSSSRMIINLQSDGDIEEVIVLQFNVRLRDGAVLQNTFFNGVWGWDFSKDTVPLQRGADFNIDFHSDTRHIKVKLWNCVCQMEDSLFLK